MRINASECAHSGGRCRQPACLRPPYHSIRIAHLPCTPGQTHRETSRLVGRSPRPVFAGYFLAFFGFDAGCRCRHIAVLYYVQPCHSCSSPALPFSELSGLGWPKHGKERRARKFARWHIIRAILRVAHGNQSLAAQAWRCLSSARPEQ